MKRNDTADQKGAPGRRRRSVLISAALPILAIVFALPSRAQTGATLPTSDDCYTCHDDPSLKSNAGKSVYVDKDAFDQSIHAKAGMTCLRCHKDFLTAPELPHPSPLKPVSCKSCHAGMTGGVAGPAAHSVRKEPRTFIARLIKVFYIVLILSLMSAFLAYIGADLFRRRRNP